MPPLPPVSRWQTNVDSIAFSLFVDWLRLSKTESEANPNNNLMMRRAGLSRQTLRNLGCSLLVPTGTYSEFGFIQSLMVSCVSFTCGGFHCSASLALLHCCALFLCFTTILYSHCAFLCSLAGVQCGVKRTRTEARHPAAAYHHANNC